MQQIKHLNQDPNNNHPSDHQGTFDWQKIALQLLTSRALDDLEEYDLVKQKKVLYQFSARGHDLAQIILGQILNRKKMRSQVITGHGLCYWPWAFRLISFYKPQ